MGRFDELVAGLVHELGNPIAAIQLRGQVFKRSLPQQLDPISQKASDAVDSMLAASARMEGILRNMSALARNEQGESFVSVPVRSLVKEALDFSRERCAARGVTLSITPYDSALTILCRETQIFQFLVNLINNACDAVQELKDRWIVVSISEQGPDIQITVTDSGRGISVNVQESLFKPFVTTKAPGKGTGLGLYISRQIAEQHGGRLSLDNSAAHTRFMLSLPKG